MERQSLDSLVKLNEKIINKGRLALALSQTEHDNAAKLRRIAYCCCVYAKEINQVIHRNGG